MKKVLFISLVVVLALSVGLVGCAPAEEEEEIPPKPTKIVIGRTVSSSGANAMIHFGAGYPMMELFEIMVNGDCGGVLCGKVPCTCTFPTGWGQGIHLKEYDKPGDPCYVPIEFKVYDDYSDVGKAVANMVKLITTDKVDFVWSGTGTHMIHALAPVADKYEMVMLTLEGGATEIKKELIEDLPYLFVTLSFSDWYQLPVLAKMWKKAGIDSAFISYIWDQHGFEYLEVAKKEFDKAGIAVVGEFPMDYAFDDFGKVIDKAKESGAEAFCGFTYPVHLFPLGPTMAAMKYNPEAIIMGPGACFGYYPYEGFAHADHAEGIMTFATANPKTVVPGATFPMDWLFTTVAKIMSPWCEAVLKTPPGMGWLFNDYWGHSLYWAMCEIFKTAVEDVGYVSQTKLREKLASYNSPATGINTILGKTWYHMFGDGGGILDYKCHTGEIGQWQGGIPGLPHDRPPAGPPKGVFEGSVEIVGYEGIATELPNYRVTADFKLMKDKWVWLLD